MAGPLYSARNGLSSLSLSLRCFVCLGPVVLITVAALFLLALALVIANKTLFLAAVLFIIPVFLPIATPILASVISHDHVVIDDG